MAAVIEPAFNISIDGFKKSWLVFGDRMRSINGTWHAKMRPHDQALIDITMHDDTVKESAKR